MRLRECEYFEAVLQYGSIRAASKVLHVSEPTISVQLRTLERELGTTLFSRETRRLRLTPKGEVLAPCILQVLVAARAVQKTADELRDPSGTFTVGLVPSHAPYMVGDLMTLFREEYPKQVLEVTESGSLTLERELLNGRLDLAVLVRAPGVSADTKRLAAVRLISGSLVALIPPTHPHAGRKEVNFDDLADDSLLLYKPGYIVREIVTGMLGAKKSMAVMYNSDNSAATRELVRKGLGISFATDFDLASVRAQADDLVKVKIKDAPPLELCCVYLEGRHVPRLVAQQLTERMADLR